MREAFFIVIVVLALLGLTAIRYRKQIAGMIGLARLLQDAKKASAGARHGSPQPISVQLVNCVRCGVWVPKDKAVRRGQDHVCSGCV